MIVHLWVGCHSVVSFEGRQGGHGGQGRLEERVSESPRVGLERRSETRSIVEVFFVETNSEELETCSFCLARKLTLLRRLSLGGNLRVSWKYGCTLEPFNSLVQDSSKKEAPWRRTPNQEINTKLENKADTLA